MAYQEIDEGLQWYYLDSTGQEFGPFPSDTMRDWFQQGHFPIGEEMLVRLPTWRNHVPLREIYADVADAFRGSPRAGGPCRGAAQPPAPDYAAYTSERQLEDVGHLVAQPQAYAGYWMMPPASPYPPPAVGYGFPPPARPPVAYAPPPPPRHGYGGGVPQSAMSGGRFQGRIKSFNAKQGFGFIECPEAHEIFGRDVFLHKAQIGDLKVGTQVTYTVEMNRQGMPQARELATLDGRPPGPSPQSFGKGVAGGGPSGGGRGKGGGRKGDGGRKGGGRGSTDRSGGPPQH